MIVNCLNCGKEIKCSPSRVRKYCCISCQLNYEYKTGKRDKFKTGIKARQVSNKKMLEHNWLNDDSSRIKLKKVMNTDEYKLKSRLSKLGVKNPMYGKTGELAGNYKGGSYRTIYGSADRGFNWKYIRKKVIVRDDYTCQICGVKEKDLNQHLQVHHILPYSCSKDSSIKNLITVCSKCHAKIEPRWCKVQKIEHIIKPIKVYNLSVQDDESYVANDIVSHNCRSKAVFIPVKK